MSSHRRGPWSNTEDNYLMQLVQAHGPLNWVRIAQTLGSRTPKQCRERYHQNLKPTLNHEPITPEEGVEIERMVQEIGKRWAEIARRLRGRSDNAVKNWWNGSQNRRKRLDRRRAAAHAEEAGGAGQPGPAPPAAQAHATPFEGYRCPRVAPVATSTAMHGAMSMSMSPGSLPLPRSAACPRSAGVEGNGYHRHMSWAEAPLPSPCSSEFAESDAGSNYTTSPADSSRTLVQEDAIELPPLRTWQPSNPRGARLPSLSSLASPAPTPVGGWRPRLPRPGASVQLPTAPNSPAQSQGENQEGKAETATGDRDARMNLAALLA